jgi:hypothetical protein
MSLVARLRLRLRTKAEIPSADAPELVKPNA